MIILLILIIIIISFKIYENIQKDKITKYKQSFIDYCIFSKNNFNQTDFYNIQKNKDLETVLIEFRDLPHIEYLIKNTISKLSDNWSHSVICNDDNYELVKDICKKISPNINIIKINYSVKNVNDYNNLLLSKEFWNLFHGSKLLIYQEDTIMYHGNIEPFLKYDYIGAPWNNEMVKGGYGGNGGFSLRTKKVMIECLNKIKPTKDYFDFFRGLDVQAEDFYFCKTIHQFKLGLLADRETSRRFAEETIPGINPVGAHQFWLSK